MACHGNPALSSKLQNGETISLYVDRNGFAHSVHGKFECVACHFDVSRVPHAAEQFVNRRAVTLRYYELCKRCHFQEYSRLLDGVHYAEIAKGNPRAPTCVDCHGAHAIAPPAKPRVLISRTCARCHSGVGAAYASSVHGRALTEENNPDVPVCTDCHDPHNNSNPLAASWHLNIPQLCARCHASKERMAKYGISTEVLTTYLNDFHGVTASLYRSEHKSPVEFTATCTDCHGVHNIARVDGASSPLIKANLLSTCRRCHPDASASFPSAWIGHYEPSPEHAPLVYAVKLFYLLFIPFVIGGLGLQIILHLWRIVVRR